MRRLHLFACLLPVLVLAGCATPPPPSCIAWEKQAGQAAVSSVSLLSPELNKIIGVTGVGTGRSGTGNATIYSTVYNCSGADVVLSMRTRFMGATGQSEPPSAWKTVHLPPNGQASYGEAAVSTATLSLAIDIYNANRGQMQTLSPPPDKK